MDKLPVITIDGPAGAGKTTLASMLARKLGLPYLDTGAMFRCLALCVAEHGGPEHLRECLDSLEFSLAGNGDKTCLLCNGRPVGEEIRSENIGALASSLATLTETRNFMLKAQQAIGNTTPLVTEGRDMGSVVFPAAAFKFFLEADPAIRAKRRYEQYLSKGIQMNMAELEEKIRQRDEQDKTRTVAPLKAAADAIVIDTGNLTEQQVLDLMLQHINAKKKH